MQTQFIDQIAEELNLNTAQVTATAALIADGGTVPFIARYRKEQTGELDEVQIMNIRDRLQQLADLAARRESIKSSLKERNLLSDELEGKIDANSATDQAFEGIDFEQLDAEFGAHIEGYRAG